MSHQRYVSKELTHFAGKHLNSQEEQYALLVHDILRKGRLGKPDMVDGTVSPEGFTMSTSVGEKICGNQMYEPRMVCFCDIPVADLSLHIRKYSKFGLAFKKDYMLDRGATPVFYASATSIDRFGSHFLPRTPHSHSVVLNAIVETYHSLFQEVFHLVCKGRKEEETCPEGLKPLLTRLRVLKSDLDMYVFSYFKCFDARKDDDDEENFYMECEWRVLGAVTFSLEDVFRVIIPSSFSKRFRQDVPEYVGQISFAD
jgi:hypothetical protein